MPLFEITSHLSASLWNRPAYRLHHRISTFVSCNSTPWINVLRRCDGDAIQRQQAPSNKADVEGDHRCRSRLNMRLCESGAYDGHFPKNSFGLRLESTAAVYSKISVQRHFVGRFERCTSSIFWNSFERVALSETPLHARTEEDSWTTKQSIR